MTTWYREFQNILETNIPHVYSDLEKISDTINENELEIPTDVEEEDFDAPFIWSSYIINGDNKSLDEKNIKLADKFLNSMAPFVPVEITGVPYLSNNYYKFDPSVQKGELVTYLFRKN